MGGMEGAPLAKLLGRTKSMKARRGSRFPGQGQASWQSDFGCLTHPIDFVLNGQWLHLDFGAPLSALK